jgi:hypothetical protein
MCFGLLYHFALIMLSEMSLTNKNLILDYKSLVIEVFDLINTFVSDTSDAWSTRGL